MGRSIKHKEKYYENKIKALLKARGAWYIKYFGGGYYSRPGTPDILACYRGRFIAIEMKSEHGRVSQKQREEMARIESAGGIGCFIYPVNMDAVESILNALDKGIEPGHHWEPERKRRRRD